MPLQPPNNYPCVQEQSPYREEVQRAYALFLQEIHETEGWEDGGVKDDVKLEKKQLPGQDLPVTRGTCLIENATTDMIIPIVQVPGIRKKWDPRFADAYILRRFSLLNYQFYSTGTSPSWFVSARDLSGVHQTYVEEQADDSEFGKNKKIDLIQVSVKDDERCSVQKGFTRMSIDLSGFRLIPQGNDVKLIYMVQVLTLGGSLPNAAVGQVLKDLPACAGKLRDTYYQYGAPPHVNHAGSLETRSTQENEIFHFGPSKNGVHEPLPNDRHWHVFMTGKSGGNFEVIYDTKRMYSKEGGVHASVFGEAADGVTVVDDGEGLINVRVGEAADGKRFEIVVAPMGAKIVALNS